MLWEHNVKRVVGLKLMPTTNAKTSPHTSQEATVQFALARKGPMSKIKLAANVPVQNYSTWIE